MSAYTPPPEFVVEFHRGRIHDTFATYSDQDALDRGVAWEAAGFEVDIRPIDRPEIPEGLRPFEEVAA